MADVNVDRALKKYENQAALERVWFQLTKDMFRNFAFYEVLDKLLEASSESLKRETKGNKRRAGKFIKSEARKLIDQEHTISSIALEYGIEVKKDKMICPFHNDTDPSLSFSDEMGVWNCFGCHAKGDIVEFKRRLMEIGFKKKC